MSNLKPNAKRNATMSDKLGYLKLTGSYELWVMGNTK